MSIYINRWKSIQYISEWRTRAAFTVLIIRNHKTDILTKLKSLYVKEKQQVLTFWNLISLAFIKENNTRRRGLRHGYEQREWKQTAISTRVSIQGLQTPCVLFNPRKNRFPRKQLGFKKVIVISLTYLGVTEKFLYSIRNVEDLPSWTRYSQKKRIQFLQFKTKNRFIFKSGRAIHLKLFSLDYMIRIQSAYWNDDLYVCKLFSFILYNLERFFLTKL